MAFSQQRLLQTTKTLVAGRTLCFFRKGPAVVFCTDVRIAYQTGFARKSQGGSICDYLNETSLKLCSPYEENID